MDNRFIFFHDPDCDAHVQTYGHDECPDRTVAIRETAIDMGLTIVKNERKATREELYLIHMKHMVRKAEMTSVYGGGRIGEDVNVNQHSYLSAISAVGCVLSAVDSVLGGDCDRAFCNVRPPGHHANEQLSRGFCVFNNVAIGVQYALKQNPNLKIGIVDWDVHHGNGTQSVFFKNPNVFFGSIHQSPFYPHTGFEKDALNNVWNFPLPMDTNYKTYQPKLDKLLERLEDFKPDLVFISCGFDAHEADSIGGFGLKSQDYASMTKQVRKVCDKVISVLEGGYDINALKDASKHHFQAMI